MALEHQALADNHFAVFRFQLRAVARQHGLLLSFANITLETKRVIATGMNPFLPSSSILSHGLRTQPELTEVCASWPAPAKAVTGSHGGSPSRIPARSFRHSVIQGCSMIGRPLF